MDPENEWKRIQIEMNGGGVRGGSTAAGGGGVASNALAEVESALSAAAIARGQATVAKMQAKEAIERYIRTATLLKEKFSPASVETEGLVGQETTAATGGVDTGAINH